jgi:hypothetical protein
MEEESRDDLDGDRARSRDAAPLRRVVAVTPRAALAFAALFAAAPAAAQSVNGFADARFSGASTTPGLDVHDLANVAAQSFTSYTISTPPDPEEPGIFVEQRADVETDYAAGAVAMSFGSETVPLGDGSLRYGSASGRASLDEMATVESDTLPDGTDVVVRMRLHAAYGGAASHDAAPTDFRYASSKLEANAQLGTTSLGSIWFENVGDPLQTTGLFAQPTPAAELEVATEVGASLRVRLFVDCDGNNRTTRSGDFLPAASTGGTLAVVFGVEADTQGVVVRSPLLGGPYPPLANANAANALARVLPVELGAPVTVTAPEPAATASALAAAAGIARRKRRAR